VVLRFHYSRHHFKGKDKESLFRSAVPLGEGLDSPYNKYLCGFICSDIQSCNSCDEVLNKIRKMESGESEGEEWSGNAWDVNIQKSGVQINNQYIHEWNNLPEGRFTLAELKAALQGWKHFLEMPESLDSVVEVELPESR
jgi:hypothetical protein